MSKEMVEQMKAINSQMKTKAIGDSDAGGQKSIKEFKILDEKKIAELKEKAKEMGNDVEFSSVENIETEYGSGYKAIYTVSDINKLKYIMGSKDRKISNRNKPEEKKEGVTFKYVKGSPATLTVIFPETKEDNNSAVKRTEMPVTGKLDETRLSSMKSMYKGMKFTAILEVQGEIIETDASFKEGSKIILADVEMDKLLENKDIAEKLTATSLKKYEDIQKICKDVLGAKFELKKEIQVRFK